MHNNNIPPPPNSQIMMLGSMNPYPPSMDIHNCNSHLYAAAQVGFCCVATVAPLVSLPAIAPPAMAIIAASSFSVGSVLGCTIAAEAFYPVHGVTFPKKPYSCSFDN